MLFSLYYYTTSTCVFFSFVTDSAENESIMCLQYNWKPFMLTNSSNWSLISSDMIKIDLLSALTTPIIPSYKMYSYYLSSWAYKNLYHFREQPKNRNRRLCLIRDYKKTSEQNEGKNAFSNFSKHPNAGVGLTLRSCPLLPPWNLGRDFN